jgi:hypothetical protein
LITFDVTWWVSAPIGIPFWTTCCASIVDEATSVRVKMTDRIGATSHPPLVYVVPHDDQLAPTMSRNVVRTHYVESRDAIA